MRKVLILLWVGVHFHRSSFIRSVIRSYVFLSFVGYFAFLTPTHCRKSGENWKSRKKWKEWKSCQSWESSPREAINASDSRRANSPHSLLHFGILRCSFSLSSCLAYPLCFLSLFEFSLWSYLKSLVCSLNPQPKIKRFPLKLPTIRNRTTWTTLSPRAPHAHSSEYIKESHCRITSGSLNNPPISTWAVSCPRSLALSWSHPALVLLGPPRSSARSRVCVQIGAARRRSGFSLCTSTTTSPTSPPRKRHWL